jgi:hypothetical protein
MAFSKRHRPLSQQIGLVRHHQRRPQLIAIAGAFNQVPLMKKQKHNT